MYFRVVSLLLLALLSHTTWGQDTRDFKQFLNRRVNPCEDFYQYACGKWTSNNIEADDVITDQKMENRYTLKKYFSSLRRRGIHDNPASEFYQLCVNSRYESEVDILQPYLKALMEFSQWPYLNGTFSETTFDWLQAAANLRRFQVDTLFKLTVQRSWKDSRQHLIYMSPLKKQFYGPADGDSAFMYKTYVKYILLGFGVRVRKANLIAQEVVDLEMNLDKLKEHVADELINPISIDELAQQTPGLNWRLYFETLFGKPIKRSQLIVLQVELFKKLGLLLDKTKPETLALSQLTRFFRHYQVRMDAPDWISCIDEVNAKMPLLVAKNFLSLRKTFRTAEVRKIFENVKEEFLQQINETNWYESNSKEDVRRKLESVKILIGYSETELLSQPEIEIDRQSYQTSRMLLDKLASTNEFELLTRSSSSAVENHRPMNVNAYYKLTTNTLEIPIGILQPPIYREESNIAQIMGSLGTIIAHELVHGFDYDGQHYDRQGNVKEESNPKMTIQFGLRASCYLDQYSRGQVAALNEDIADNEGLRLSFGTYEKLRNDNLYSDATISGDQLFFISFAQVWCGSDAYTSKTRNHSSHKDRVNNVVANSEEFSKAFSCPRGSALNPTKKCKIW